MRVRTTLGSLVLTFALATPALAQDGSEAEGAATPSPPPPTEAPQAKSLDELLGLVKQGFSEERKRNEAREQRFEQAKVEQASTLASTLAVLERQQARSQRLETTFNTNETTLAEQQDKLEKRLGNLGELFGVVRQVAGDMQGHVWESVTSAEIKDRKGILEKLGRSTALPTTQDLEKLWYELHREMTQQGKVVRFPTTVLTTEGSEEPREVIRAGVFSVISGGEYLLWESSIQKIRELNRQPPSRYVQTVAPFEASQEGIATLAIDPSRGSLLTALIDTPSGTERVQQGGAVGYAIILIGVMAGIVGVAKWITLSITSRKVKAQRERMDARDDNPLGRVLGVFEENKQLDPEALELKLDQAVLAEADRLDRYMWLVRVVSVVAPLMGLLGTVTGMIQTFQAITLFGAGDPKMMAGGISEALVTTMLGLITAAPLVLLYAFLSTSRKRIMSVLAGQSAGLVATRLEDAGA